MVITKRTQILIKTLYFVHKSVKHKERTLLNKHFKATDKYLINIERIDDIFLKFFLSVPIY